MNTTSCGLQRDGRLINQINKVVCPFCCGNCTVPLDLRKMDRAGMTVVRLETAVEAAVALNVQRDRSNSMFHEKIF